MRPQPKTSPCVRCGHPAFPWSAGDAPLCAKCIVDGVEAMQADEEIEPGRMLYIDDPVWCASCRRAHVTGDNFLCETDYPHYSKAIRRRLEKQRTWRVRRGQPSPFFDQLQVLLAIVVVLGAIACGVVMWGAP